MLWWYLPFWTCTIYIHPSFLAANFRKCRCCRLCCSKSWTTMKQSIFVTLMMLNACGFIDSSKIFPILQIFLRNRVGINQCLIWLLIYWSRQARDSKSCTFHVGTASGKTDWGSCKSNLEKLGVQLFCFKHYNFWLNATSNQLKSKFTICTTLRCNI